MSGQIVPKCSASLVLAAIKFDKVVALIVLLLALAWIELEKRGLQL